jgi:hypothetical protein
LRGPGLTAYKVQKTKIEHEDNMTGGPALEDGRQRKVILKIISIKTTG